MLYKVSLSVCLIFYYSFLVNMHVCFLQTKIDFKKWWRLYRNLTCSFLQQPDNQIYSTLLEVFDCFFCSLHLPCLKFSLFSYSLLVYIIFESFFTVYCNVQANRDVLDISVWEQPICPHSQIIEKKIKL